MNDKIYRIALVGTGTLGTQIATLAACFGYEVAAYDADEEAFKRVRQYLKTTIKVSGRKPVLPMENWENGANRVKRCKVLEEAVRDADLVIEAVPEDLDLKRKTFQSLDTLAPGRAILATNSSSIPISKIESATARPEKCLNTHFYSLVTGSNMVDVMGGTKTTAETMEAVKAWIRSIGCFPITVKKEILGLCFNRIWRAIKRESLYMWAEGFVDFKDIDRAWMINYGTPQGPFGLMDRIGLDVVYDIEMIYYNESKDSRDRPPVAFKAMVDKKELGVKTNKGFYTYPDPEFSRSGFLKE
ncbi:MAG: 3-hydroxyacyl-CoA dehydrogenase NAD-binding domain-containing protein [Desulfatiglandales bacterium]|jgi:3-hydroxybutyryl-CoA dehydrogenase|nr:3-hydroxyacyl-CoA dehydrogenase NAD-binding domain-containing protein [Desulfatiglandales bacterium]